MFHLYGPSSGSMAFTGVVKVPFCDVVLVPDLLPGVFPVFLEEVVHVFDECRYPDWVVDVAGNEGVVKQSFVVVVVVEVLE